MIISSITESPSPWAMAVLGEVDHNADMGSVPAVKRIMGMIPKHHQTVLFSAGLGGDVNTAIRDYQNDLKRHEIAAKSGAADDNHYFWNVNLDTKVVTVTNIAVHFKRVISFCRTKHICNRVARELEDLGVCSCIIHGNRRQAQLERAIEQFRATGSHHARDGNITDERVDQHHLVTPVRHNDCMAEVPFIKINGHHDDRLLGDLIQAIKEVESIIVALANLTGGLQLPFFQWVVCYDFAAEVDELIRGNGVPAFTTDRLGGEVAAKTLSDPANPRSKLIALNGRLLLNPEKQFGFADQVFLVAHELTHVVQGAVRQLSGVMTDVPIPSETIRQVWRSIVRIAADEYRADRVAARILGQVVSLDQSPNECRPATIRDTWAFEYLTSAEGVALELYPALPDLVQSYRTKSIPFEEFVQQLGRLTEESITVLAHWQATVDSLEIPDNPWTLGDLPDSRAAQLYLRPLWESVFACIAAQPILPTSSQLQELEPALLMVGEKSIEAMWETLGITLETMPGGAEYVHVSDPIR